MTAAHPAIPAVCPACGHATVQCVGGQCTAFVANDDPAGPPAVYCGHDCYEAITGRSLIDVIADLFHPTTTEEQQ